MKTKLILLAALCLAACKKSDAPKAKVNQTLVVAVTGVTSGKSFDINISDLTNYNSSTAPVPFFSVSNVTSNQTYNVNVYSGEHIGYVVNFNGNYGNVPGGITSTLTVNGNVLLTTPSNESSGGHMVTIP